MPSGSYKGKADVLCPFYKFDDFKKRRIVCEGLLDQSTLALTYLLRDDFNTQLEVFCCERYKNCEIFRMLMESKYDEED